jgi:phenylpyruvate tautomerase PptA (4-oxalocrotonate tautomerase family)
MSHGIFWQNNFNAATEIEGDNMPVYQFYSPKGLLTQSAKTQIAEELTTMYSKETGALPSWVKVLFHEISEGDSYTGGKPTKQSLILGINRHGRDLESRRATLRQLSQIWTRATGQPEDDLWISVTETDHTNEMDAGLFIPGPGHEREWLEENRTRLEELGIAL